MEQVRNYQPKAVEFPELNIEEAQIQLERIDEEAIRQHLYQSLPIADLMAWLVNHYGTYQDITLLRQYHVLIRLPDITAIPQAKQTRIELKRVAISLHSHTLNTL